MQDFITILKVNSYPDSNYPFPTDTKLSVVGQLIEADGYVDDYAIEISSIDVNNKTIIADPDFFGFVTGYQIGSANVGVYTFFQLVQDAVNLSRFQIIPTTSVNYVYPNKTQIEVAKYDYPLGQLFYAYDEGVFYSTVQDITVTTPSYIV